MISYLYITTVFCSLTLVGLLVFGAINRVCNADWFAPLYPLTRVLTAPLWVCMVTQWGVLAFIALQADSGYPQPLWLLGRSLLYMAGYALYRYALFQKSKRYEILLLIFSFISITPIAYDWLVPPAVHWYSSLLGWYVFSSFLLSGVALLIVAAVYAQRKGYLPEVKPQHWHDLGKYLFAFAFVWAYLWFSQYMLIWYTNIPEETAYYQRWWTNGYAPTVLLMLVFTFVVPFVGLMSAHNKRNPKWLIAVSVSVLLGQYLNIAVLLS